MRFKTGAAFVPASELFDTSQHGHEIAKRRKREN